MRTTILGLMAGLIVATPANAERYAVSCSGTSTVTMKRPGESVPDKVSDLNAVVYVIDDEAHTVHRLVPSQHLLDRVCGSEGMTCTSDFTAGRVTIKGSAIIESNKRVLDFSFDRSSGEMVSVLGIVAADRSIMQRWSMRCVSAAIPIV